jgi:thiol:disulfide interchange protein DsbD
MLKEMIFLSNMRLLRLALPICFLFCAGLPLLAATNAVDAPHVHVELLVPGANLYSSDQLNDAGLYFKLEPGWHVYWKNAGDAGEPPHMRWTLPTGITAGALQFPAPKRLPLGPLMDFGYEDEVLFPFKIQVAQGAKAGPATLHAKVDWLVCQNSCIPGKAELEVQANVDAGARKGGYAVSPLFKRYYDRLPKPLPHGSRVGFKETADGFRLTVETGHRETEATFFPADQDILSNPAPQKLASTARGLTLDLKKDAELKTSPAQLRGVLELAGGRVFEVVALPGMAAAALAPVADSGKPAPAAQAAPTGNSAGVDAGTPSSQPAVDTGRALANAQSEAIPAKAPGESAPWAALLRASGLAFLGGLLLNLMPCVFPVLFLKGLALAQSGSQLQSDPEEKRSLRLHGFVYAAGILASFWVLVGVLLGLRAAGAVLGWGFQFQSPVFLSLMAGLLFFLGLSLAGQFEIGLTLTSAGGSLAQKQGFAGSFFTGVLAVVVATPCTAPLMGAAIGYALSQSVLVTFAVFTMLALGLAAPYVALTLQPAWTRLMPRPGAWMEVLKQATAVPIFATVIWLAWVLAQAYGANTLVALLAGFLLLAIAGWFLGRWPAKRWATAVSVALLAGVVALAVLGARYAGESRAGSDRAGNGSQEPTKPGDWQPWSAEAVNRAQSVGRPVFVDFTAAWCLSCQVNERVALQKPEVEEAFHTANVLLLKADWTRHDEQITQTLTALGRSGVPTYVLYTPGEKNPQLLPEALTPGIVLGALGKLPPVHAGL